MKIPAGWCALLMLGIATASAYDVVPKMAWWYDARFGMIIHFGSYSYYANGEWEFFNGNWTKTNYQTQISAHFNPANFNATAIVSAAKAAGMKYIVITAKHHEGFAMWHSAVPSFTDVTGTKLYNLYDYAGFHRDLLRELKNACDAQGIKFCLYYSILDWDHPSQTVDHPNYFSDMSSLTARANYINDMKAQLSELITNYQPALLWFDGDWWPYSDGPATVTNWWNKSDGIDLYNYLIGLKSDLIINERVKRGYGLGDFTIAEQTVPAAALARPWETGATMNGAWGYATWAENNYRSASNILAELVQVVSRDGNYMLNIGPMGDGTMTSGSTNILGQLAIWMNVYGESVHGTTASPFGASEPSWGYYTKRSGKLYAHVLTWPGTRLQIPSLTNTITRVYLLNDTNTSLGYVNNGAGITITLPASAPNAMDSVVAMEMNGVPTSAVIPPVLSDLGGTAPVPGPNDISQLSTAGNQTFPDGLNYFTDNQTGHGAGEPGQTFTTGTNSSGYLLTSVAVRTAGIGTSSGTSTAQPYYLHIYSMSGSTATLLQTYTSGNIAFNDGDWLKWTGISVPLSANATYAYSFGKASSTTGWEPMAVATNKYAGGEIALIPTGGGGITTGSSHRFDATFVLGLASNTPPVFASISDRTVNVGQTVAFTASATDTDTPPQKLTFALLAGTTNTTFDPNSGTFSFRPLVPQAGSTNFSFSIDGQSGPDYAVETSTNLTQWSNVFITNSPALPFVWIDTNSAAPQRFYRVKLGPPLP